VAPLLREHGLAPAALYLLAAVERHPYPTELAREFGLPAPSVSRWLRDLETQGYLVRATVPEDLRRYRLELTPRGAQVRAAVQAGVAREMGVLLGRLQPGERGELLRLLRAVAAETGEGNGPPPSADADDLSIHGD